MLDRWKQFIRPPRPVNLNLFKGSGFQYKPTAHHFALFWQASIIPDLATNDQYKSYIQISLGTSSNRYGGWELMANPAKSEHFRVGGTSNLVVYTLLSRNQEHNPTVSTVRDLGLSLNTGLKR